MTLYNQKRFTVPATNPQRTTLCKVHHIVKGQCLRCPHKVVSVQREKSSRMTAPRPAK